MHGSLILGNEKQDPPSDFKQGPKMVDMMTLPNYLINKQELTSFAEPNVVNLKSTKNRDYRAANTYFESELQEII